MEEVFDTTVAVVTADEVRRERAAARGHALVDEREARQLAQDEKAARAEHVDRERRLGRGSGAGAVRADREAAGMSAGRRRRRGWPRRRRRGRSALVVGVMVASGKFDQAIQELTLPLRHEDMIRQQAARKGSRRGADRRGDLLGVEVQRRDLERRRPRADADHAGSGERNRAPQRRHHLQARRPLRSRNQHPLRHLPACANCSTATTATRSPRSPPTTPGPATPTSGAAAT